MPIFTRQWVNWPCLSVHFTDAIRSLIQKSKSKISLILTIFVTPISFSDLLISLSSFTYVITNSPFMLGSSYGATQGTPPPNGLIPFLFVVIRKQIYWKSIVPKAVKVIIIKKFSKAEYTDLFSSQYFGYYRQL